MADVNQMNLLSAAEQIVELALDSKLSKEFYRKADKYIRYLSERLELTKEQSVLLALFLNNSENSRITIKDFGDYLNCSTVKMLSCLADIDILEKREFVICRHGETSTTYRVPYEVIIAFKKNEKFVPENLSGLTCLVLFAKLNYYFELRRHGELTYDILIEKIKNLFECNKELPYIQKIRSYGFDVSDGVLLVLFTHLFVNNNDDSIRFHDIDFMYDDNDGLWNHIKPQLYNGDHFLMECNMIEFDNSDGFVDREAFRLSEKAKRELLSELKLPSMDKANHCGNLIKSADISHKQLFYGDKISSQILELGKLLNDAHYNDIRARMKDTGFRCGFACLFYGAPGTGKTETVLQLAKQTGRNVMQVNISQIKSMWVGESEKNIKRIFDNYRTLVENSKIVPILLFNEADAVIGIRREGATRAVDKMENTIQNIILQEMEKLDGILIATTNLVENLDKAFERRFLYKIKFEKPNLEARMNIWQEMIPGLDADDTRMLAIKYNFSGGQIENIARHYTIGNILHGNTENVLERISEYCDNERLDSKEIRKIGF